MEVEHSLVLSFYMGGATAPVSVASYWATPEQTLLNAPSSFSKLRARWVYGSFCVLSLICWCIEAKQSPSKHLTCVLAGLFGSHSTSANRSSKFVLTLLFFLTIFTQGLPALLTPGPEHTSILPSISLDHKALVGSPGISF